MSSVSGSMLSASRRMTVLRRSMIPLLGTRMHHHHEVIRLRNRTAVAGDASQYQLHCSEPISWYACGPTVYDSAHLGHARTYVATDIIRRIVNDYFDTPVTFAMGITDIDDKIINKGKEKNFVKREEFLAMATELEYEFFDDLDKLQVQRPDAVLRVSEHIPDIVQFIASLLHKKHAYVAQDGVYFNFASLPESFTYDRFGCVPPIAEIEAAETQTYNLVHALPVDAQQSDFALLPQTKKDPRDFALWKRAQVSDPHWESPWGIGRPGWHIECSAMTKAIFGDKLDVHSGGIDLQFPHHTNEIAQSECCSGSSWVRMWLHTGHLHIEGRKMSKSLKNFISIRDYFAMQWTNAPADDFRLFCLLHKYDATLTFSVERIRDAASLRGKFTAFFTLTESLIQRRDLTDDQKSSGEVRQQWQRRPTKNSKALQEKIQSTRKEVRTALSSDFDTPRAMQLLGDLVGEAMQYALAQLTIVNKASGEDKNGVELESLEVLSSVERYVKHVLSTLGLQFALCNNSNEFKASPSNNHQLLPECVQSIVDFRSAVRTIATSSMKSVKQLSKSPDTVADSNAWKQLATTQSQDLLKLTDAARQSLGDALHISIDDLGASGSVWKSK